MKIRARLDNIWYHYKVHILIGLFLLACVLLGIGSCTQVPTYDLQVYYITDPSVTPVYSEQLAWIEETLQRYYGDLSNPSPNIALTNLRLTADGTALRAEYMTAVHAGDVTLFVADEEGIAYLRSHGFLQYLGAGEEGFLLEGYAFPLTSSPVGSEREGQTLFEKTEIYVALRVIDGTWASMKSSVKRNGERAKATLDRIMNDAYVQEKTGS